MSRKFLNTLYVWWITLDIIKLSPVHWYTPQDISIGLNNLNVGNHGLITTQLTVKVLQKSRPKLSNRLILYEMWKKPLTVATKSSK